MTSEPTSHLAKITKCNKSTCYSLWFLVEKFHDPLTSEMVFLCLFAGCTCRWFLIIIWMKKFSVIAVDKYISTWNIKITSVYMSRNVIKHCMCMFTCLHVYAERQILRCLRLLCFLVILGNTGSQVMLMQAKNNRLRYWNKKNIN